MNAELSPENAAAAARHVRGATIAWGAGKYLDFEDPDNIRVTLEEYAYCLAFTPRWRGQTKSPFIGRPNKHRFFGVGQHCIEGAFHLLTEGHSLADARAFLFHESDEVPFGDFPGPLKKLPEVAPIIALAKRIGASIDRGFDFTVPDPDLIKRWDIRMLATERRDLLSEDYLGDNWAHDGDGDEVGLYEAFPKKLVPYGDPSLAGEKWLELELFTRVR